MESLNRKKVRKLNDSYIEKQAALTEQRQQSSKGIRRRLIALAIFVTVVFVVTGYALHTQNSVLQGKLQKKELLDAELTTLEMIERDLNYEIRNLNDLEYISEVARRDYFLTKPGEIIFKLPAISSD